MDDSNARSRHPEIMRQALLWALLPTLVLFLIAPAVGDAQQVVTTNITSSGLGTVVPIQPPSDGVYNITGGTRPGDGPNLFHSFGEFTVGGGDIANLLNNTGLPTSNILGRVTGGNTSNINGTIQTTDFGNANLFLVNPSGIVFGPNGSVNVGGSVSFTTAQYLRLFDGVNSGNFYANPASDGLTNSILAIDASAFEFLSASPAAYGFLTAPDPTATITFQGSNLSISPALPDTPPNSISLVGGKVVIEGGAELSAPSGRIHLATAASPGEFAALPGESLANATSLQAVPNNPVDPSSAAAFTSYGLVSLAPGSSIDVHGTSTVFIKGGQLVLSMNDATLSTSESPAPSDTISLGPGSSIVTSNSGADPGADVQMTAGAVQMDGAMIQTINSGDLDGGNISINATTVGFINGALVQSSTGLDFTTGQTGSGNGGNVTVQGLGGAGSSADSVALSNGSAMFMLTSGPGRGGDVQLSARTLTMDNSSVIVTGTFGGGGVGGDVVLNVGTGSLTGGALILTLTQNSNPDGGQGGNVTIQGLLGVGSVAESVTFSGGSNMSTQSLGSSDGGRVTVTAKSLTLDGAGPAISASASAVGRGGDIVVNVQQAELSNGATIAAVTGSTDDNAQPGPTVTVQGLQGAGSMADSIILSGLGSGIVSDSIGTARAGDIAVQAKTISLTDGAVIQAGTPTTSAAGGDVTIKADSVDVSSGSHIASQASHADAGQITITANTLTLDTGFITTQSISEGRGGDVVLDVGSASLTNGATINSSSTGTGNAANVTINSASSVILQNSSMTTESSNASGGQITITAPEMVQLTDSKITTSVAGSEADTAGGNISIDPQFVVLNSSQILATAFAGSGGNISLVSNVFLSSADSVVDATSQLGISGTVDIRAPVQNVSGELVVLSQDFSSAAALLAQQCAARVADGKFSTFVVAAREGLPVEPGGFLPSPSFLTELGGLALSGQPPRAPRLAGQGLLPQYDTRPLQLAKLGNACRRGSF